jgi:hypothetical protein
LKGIAGTGAGAGAGGIACDDLGERKKREGEIEEDGVNTSLNSNLIGV